MEKQEQTAQETAAEQERRARRDRRVEQVGIFVDLRVSDRRGPSLRARLRTLWGRITGATPPAGTDI